MIFRKQLKFGLHKLLFDDTELPQENACLFIFDKKDALPRVLKMWHENPLYVATYNTSQECLETLLRTKRPIGKVIVHELFKDKYLVPDNFPIEYKENHAKIYVSEPYVLLSSANLSHNSSTEFFLFIHNSALAQKLIQTVFEVAL